MASVEGLNGLSIGRLATDLGISKSGIATLFGSKEALQLAAIRAARDVFVAHVVAPALGAPRGRARVRTLVERWFTYVTDDPPFPGGCFRSAAVVEYDSRPGPVRDALAADRADWLALLATEIRKAQELGELPDRDPDALAFELDAILCAVNTAHQLGDDSKADLAHGILDRLLG